MNLPGSRRKDTIVTRFLESASRYPDRPALEKGPVSVTYRELAESAICIAGLIRDSGDNRPFAAVMADKTPACYAAILGILMTGKGYLPLNPRFPSSRNRFMMEKAGVRNLIHDGGLTPQDINEVQNIKPDPAYLLFTSGTTGEPKGVQISHPNVAAYIESMMKFYDFRAEDRFTQNFDLTFDLSVHDLFLCWSAGACLCVPEDASSFSMAKFIREKQPTVWFSVPSVVNLMERMRLLKPGAFTSLRLSFFCGEPLYLNTVEAWQRAAPLSRVINLYGPTEATIAISRYEIPTSRDEIKQEMGIVSIGKVFENNGFEIVQGELCLWGAQVVESYFNNPQADQQSFRIGRKNHDKCYKTGDLIKADREGDLFYLGRLDSEVKVSGYRVNLNEIENHINGYESVDQCVVLYDARDDGQGMLFAFVLIKPGRTVYELEIDQYCRQSLPWYMVPGKVIFVEKFPLNFNRKIDKASLKEIYLHGK